MKLKAGKLFVILMTFALLVMPALAWDVPSQSHTASAMWLEPPVVTFVTATTNVGDTFNVTVYLNASLAKIASWEYMIHYDSSWLNAINAVYSGTGGAKSQLFEKAGTTGVPVAPSFGANYVLHAESYMMGTYPSSAHCPSSVGYITFNITALPPKGGSLSSVLNLTDVDTYIQDDTGKKYGPVDDGNPATPWEYMPVFNTAVSFTWTSPPKPWMGVISPYIDPPGKTYDRYTNWNGTTFGVGLYIKSLSGAWFITNASFRLTYNVNLLQVVAIAFNFADWTGPNAYDNTTTPGLIDFFAQTSLNLTTGDKLVVTVTFKIWNQKTYPTMSTSDLDFSNVVLMNHNIEILTDPTKQQDGKVIVEGLLTLPLPYLKVNPSATVLGPAPAIGDTFTLNIDLCNLHFAWYLVGVDFRMTYDPTLLEVVSMTEGPYFPTFNQSMTPPYTFFIAFDEGTYVTAMDIVLPNGTGQYPGPLPGGTTPQNGTIAKITFEVIKQDIGCNPITYTSAFNLYDIMMVDKAGGYVPYDSPKNGTYTIYGSYEVGRLIDVYTQYPAPYGGQGIGMNSDMFWPQKEVCVTAYVSYNCWPLQNKLVTFTLFDKQGGVWSQLIDPTDSEGYAHACFRMPWPCDDPESLFGVWSITADVDIACIVVNDTVRFHYDYLVNILKVTTDKYYYMHCETVHITVNFTSHAQQNYTVAIWVTIHDNLNYPIGATSLTFTVGGAVYCTAKQYIKPFDIHIDKFAAAGEATVYASSRLLWNGSWVAAGPMASTTIYILPAWVP